MGGGVEYAITNNISVGIEGRYTWYGDHTISNVTASPTVPHPDDPDRPDPSPTHHGLARCRE